MSSAIAFETFEHVSTDTISSLNLELQTFKHKTTGALHYHFAADNNENVFLVGFRTVPTDSTGVAHILEHTALCGSEKYPVRDPFFMMLRRSLNTFMNALTSSDWTAYPFASCNKKDFDNLLSVYLDATFFSRLDPLDFAQEGHRVEFTESDNAESDLEYKGVVFNEMKGAMSSVSSVLWHTLTKHLFTETTYHHNSGGEPADIPNLRYEELIAFYKKHYHPSNSILMTFGDIDAREHQQNFEERALHKFTADNDVIHVKNEPRLQQPKKVSEPYAASSNDDKTHVVIAWLLNETSNIKDYLEAHLLNGLLTDNSASPLRKALETSQYGSSPSPMFGLDDSSKEMLFVAGLEGCNQEDADNIEAEIIAVLQHVADHGVEQSEIDAVLHQLELHQREIGGDSYPYGMQLIMQILPAAIHRGNPAEVLNIDKALDELRQSASHPDYVKQLAKRILLNNVHRVRLSLYPDQNLAEAQKQREHDALSNKKRQLSEAEKQEIINQAKALADRQVQQDDPGLLPKVGLEDIPTELPTFTSSILKKPIKQSRYIAGTNGLVYQQLIISLDKLNEQQRALLPIYSQCLTEIGFNDKTYIQVQQHQAATVGSINSYFTVQTNYQDTNSQYGYLTLSSKALSRNYLSQTQLMVDTLQKANFSEHARIKELLSQYTAQKLQSVVQNGHSFAMQAAAAQLSPVNYFEYNCTGLKGIQHLKHLSQSLENATELESLAESLQTLHKVLLSSAMQVVEIAENELLSIQNSQNLWPTSDNTSSVIHLPAPNSQQAVFWQTNTQVNYCSMAMPTVAPTHKDAGPLAVLGGFMRNGYLHTAVREQGGAYGGGASHDVNNGVFRFYSYRDPRISGTFDDFKRSIDWVLDTSHEERALEEAILGVIGSMDKPGSPAGEAKNDFYHQLYGRSYEQRMAFRQNIINTSINDLKQVANTWLSQKPHYALISNETNIIEIADLQNEFGATIETL